MFHAKPDHPKETRVGDFSHTRHIQYWEKCLAFIQHQQHKSTFLRLVLDTENNCLNQKSKPSMTKSKKSTAKPRQTPYSTPATTTRTNTRFAPTSTVPPHSGARSLPPAPRFTPTFTNFAFPQSTLTPYEEQQSFHEFITDLLNGTDTVDESGSVGPAGIRDLERSNKGAPENAEGEESRRGGEGESKRIDQDGGVGRDGSSTQRQVLSENKGDKRMVGSSSDKGRDQPPTGSLQDLPPALNPNLLEQHPKSPKESPPPDPLTEEQKLAKLLVPVAEFNDRTPWPIPFHEQPLPPPDWHAECPDGYAPSTTAGYPQRRQYPIYSLAAHNADIVLDEYGHSCLDLDERDRCLFGKCRGCDVCRPGGCF